MLRDFEQAPNLRVLLLCPLSLPLCARGGSRTGQHSDNTLYGETQCCPEYFSTRFRSSFRNFHVHPPGGERSAGVANSRRLTLAMTRNLPSKYFPLDYLQLKLASSQEHALLPHFIFPRRLPECATSATSTTFLINRWEGATPRKHLRVAASISLREMISFNKFSLGAELQRFEENHFGQIMRTHS